MALAGEQLRQGQAEEAVREARAVIAMSPNHLEARKLLEKALARTL